MKDYSKFIPSSYGFITKYEIVGEEIHVYTPETEKGEPHKYPATKDYITYFEIRMETQYQLIVENKEVIEKYVVNKRINNVWKTVLLTSMILSITTIPFLVLTSYGAIAPILAIALAFVCGKLKVLKINDDFEEEMAIIKTYLDSRKDIEEVSKKDKNVTEYLSKKTTKRLTDNENLKEKQYLDTIFSIDFMDKTKLKDLRKLLSRYTISKNICEEQHFIIPEEEMEIVQKPATSKKTLTPDKNSKKHN